ncbi:MAG: cell division protein ZapA [Acutalibacteraceae bacterium]
MNNKRKVSVQIEGRSYALITADDEKYVQGVADEVIAQIKEIVASSHHLDTRDCAVLAALNFCDDRNKALRNKKECISKADKIIRQTNDLNKQCSEYKTRLAEVINENTALTRKYKRLQKENEQLRNALQRAVNSAQSDETAADEDGESDEILRKMRQQQISLFD